MATLQNIRNRAGILVSILIGLALIAFILTDLLSAGNSLFRANQYEVGKVNGNSFQYPEFQNKIEQLTDVYKMNTGQSQITEQIQNQIQDQVWQTFVRNSIMTGIYEKLGITISSDELFDMIQGSNIHPMIQQIFSNPETGQFDKSFVLNFIKYIDANAKDMPEQQKYWAYIQDQIILDREYMKYNNLIGKGQYITNQEVKQELENNTKTTDIQYISLPFSSIHDSTITVTEKELRDYYNQNKDQYKQEAQRTIQYVLFNVAATEEDDKNAQKWMEEIKADFASAENNQQFVNVNSDIPFDDVFQKKEELSEELAELAFNSDPGTVYGPYKEDNSYKLAKLDVRKNLPDSVNARHILIDPNVTGIEMAKSLSDSLKQLLEKGASFAELAKEYSADRGSSILGGELGWFSRNQMTKPFEDACFNGEVKKIYVVPSQFGIHIIQIMNKGKEVSQARLAILARNIEPGTQTFQQVYAKASQFAGQSTSVNDFNEAVKNQEVSKMTAIITKDDVSFQGMEQSRSLIRAAWQAKKPGILVNNERSTIFEFGNNFIVAALVGIQEEGFNPFEQVKPRVELNVKQELKSKLLFEKMNNAFASEKDFLVLANNLGTEVTEANDIRFDTYNIPALGMEPKVAGAISVLDNDQISNPIKGKNGIYIVKVISTTTNEGNDIEVEKERLLQTRQYSLGYLVFETLREAANIEDRRILFF